MGFTSWPFLYDWGKDTVRETMSRKPCVLQLWGPWYSEMASLPGGTAWRYYTSLGAVNVNITVQCSIESNI